MYNKIFLKPPKVTKPILIGQIILSILIIIFGLALFFGVYDELDKEAKPFVILFFIIWTIAGFFSIFHAVKLLSFLKKGKIEFAEIDGEKFNEGSDFARKLRDLESLRKDGLISEEEYRRKRADIMNEKW